MPPPECLHQLEEMFAHTTVDGSTSCIAGENNGDEGDEEFEREDFDREAFERDAFDSSPMSSGTKRSASTGTCATSPMKKSKSHMVKIMKGFVQNIQLNNVIAQKV